MNDPSTSKRRKYDGPTPRLDTIRDMDELKAGKLNSIDHLGLHASIDIPGEPRLYGHITYLTHQPHVTVIELTWNGVQIKYRADPQQVIRIETTI